MSWLRFVCILCGAFLLNIDTSAVSVALPDLGRATGAGPDLLQWVLSANLLASTCFLPVVGRLAELWDLKWLFSAGVAVFTAGAAGAAWSAGFGWLMVSRVVQAVGAAFIMGGAMSAIAYAFPADGRGRALGLNVSAVGLGTILGPLLAGWAVARWGWRSALWIQVPLGMAAAAACCLFLPAMPPRNRDGGSRRFDPLGALLFFLAMAAMVLALAQGPRWGGRVTAGLVAIAGVGWWGFWRWTRRGPCHTAPLLDLRLLSGRRLCIGHVTNAASYLCTLLVQFTTPLYLSEAAGAPVQEIGWILEPMAAALAVASPFGGWLGDRMGRERVCLIGMAAAAVSLVRLTSLGPGMPHWQVAAWLALFGAGIGVFQPPNNAAVLLDAPAGRAEMAGVLVATVRSFGRVSGVTVAALLFQLAAGLTAPGSPPAAAYQRAVPLEFGTAAAVAGLSCVLLWIRAGWGRLPRLRAWVRSGPRSR
ncbi:MFS transporter [Alicyclobacillus sp.]|uniref:MFS transporter n=1 Tax=Alicyclobacillus sp. TaxID=61169 RepID=UPI0025B97058|nr:MFS transporter [Alicyclobacillus sp.]MCL6517191.1 MFS transporter [Alicyclobacillus sp.]